jgi:hypothetical protein
VDCISNQDKIRAHGKSAMFGVHDPPVGSSHSGRLPAMREHIGDLSTARTDLQ